MFRRGNQNTLAIELAGDLVRVLDLKIGKKTPVITAFATQGVETGTPESLPERQIAALGTLMSTHRLKTKRCVAAMPMSLVVTRTVPIDSSKKETTEEQIRKALQNCLPFDPKDMIFDFWAAQEPAAGARTKDVLVVASQASVVQRYLTGFEKLKLNCVHMDVAPCAVASLIAGTASNPDAMVGAVALTTTSGYFAIINKQKVLFWRPFELPLAAQKNISAQVGLDRVGDEISKCVSHMAASRQLESMSEFLMFGSGSADVVFTEYLKNRFKMPVRSPSPFEMLPEGCISGELKTAAGHDIATQYAAATGLALQPAGGAIHG